MERSAGKCVTGQGDGSGNASLGSGPAPTRQHPAQTGVALPPAFKKISKKGDAYGATRLRFTRFPVTDPPARSWYFFALAKVWMTSCFRSIRKQRIEWIVVQGPSLAWQVNKPCSCRDPLPDCCLTCRSRSTHSSSTLAKIAGSGCLRRRGQGTVRPFHGVGLERINLIALKALEGRPAIGCRHRHHAPIAVRAPGGVHDKPPFSSQ